MTHARTIRSIIHAVAMPVMAAMLLAPACATAGNPAIEYFENNTAVKVLQVEVSPGPTGTTFNLYISNSSPDAVSLYLRAEGLVPQPGSGLLSDPWTRFSIAGGSAQWVKLVSVVSAEDSWIQLSFGHLFSQPVASVSGAAN